MNSPAGGTPADSAEIRRRLREWIAATARRPVEEVTDSTPFLELRLLRSVQIPDLLLFLEELRGEPVDPAKLKPGALRDVDTIARTFFGAGA